VEEIEKKVGEKRSKTSTDDVDEELLQWIPDRFQTQDSREARTQNSLG